MRKGDDSNLSDLSRPAWARGLKHVFEDIGQLVLLESRPAWARGLKR